MPICPQCYAELGWYIVVCPHCGTNVQIPKDSSKEKSRLTSSEQWKIGLAGALAVAVGVVGNILKIDRSVVLLLVWASLLVASAGYAAWRWIKHRGETKGSR